MSAVNPNVQAAAATIAADLKSTEPAIAAVAADAAAGKVDATHVVAAVKATKAGYKTTEFWGVMAAAILDVATQIPFHDKAIVGAIAAIYAIARGLAKAGAPSIS